MIFPAVIAIREPTSESGALALPDLYELLPRGETVIAGTGALALRAALRGGWTAPDGSDGGWIACELTLSAEAIRLLLARPGLELRLPVDGLAVKATIDPDRVAWSIARVRFWDGELTSSGTWELANRALEAEVRARGIEVGSFPLRDGTFVAKWIEGALDADARLVRRGDGPLSCEGTLALREPEYPMLAEVAPALAKYGLSGLSTSGNEPLLAEVRTVDAGWAFSSLTAGTPSARVRADARVESGSLFVDGVALAREGFLKSSVLLRLPAAITGDLAIPFVMRGPLASPRFRADFAGTLERLLVDSGIDAGLREIGGAIDHVLCVRPTRRSSRPPRSAPSRGGSSIEGLVRRAASGIDEDACIEALLDRGLIPDEIADRIEDAREAARRR
ncbi:MAG: hypothetical protein AB7S26_10790 [Sandaracinaceae bacterium]